MGCFLYVVIKHKEHFQVSFQLVNSFTDILLHFFLENILSSYYLVYVLDCSSGGRRESTGSCFRSFRGGGGSSCGGSCCGGSCCGGSCCGGSCCGGGSNCGCSSFGGSCGVGGSCGGRSCGGGCNSSTSSWDGCGCGRGYR